MKLCTNIIQQVNEKSIMRNPSLHTYMYIQASGLCMIVLVSLIVLLRGFPCFHDFSHGASHPYFPIQ